MGAQGERAAGPRGASCSRHPRHAATCSRPCRWRRAAPGAGGGRDPHAVPASASPTAWQPLISPPRPRRWLRRGADGTNLPGSPCQGSCPKRACRPCQANRAKRLRGRSRWRSRRFPGQRRSTGPRANIYWQGREEIDGVHNIWALPLAEPGTGGQAGRRAPPHADKHAQRHLPAAGLTAGVEGSEMGGPGGEIPPWERAPGGTRIRDVGELAGAGFLPPRAACRRAGLEGAHRGAGTPALPVPWGVTAWGTRQPRARPRREPSGSNSQDGFGVRELSGSMCRRPWGGQGFPGSPAVRRAAGVPEPAGFPAVPSWRGAAPAPCHRRSELPRAQPGSLSQGERCLPGTWHRVPPPVVPGWGGKGPERFPTLFGAR